MTKEKEKKLYNNYPELFNNKNSLIMYVKIDCFDGWYNIIDNLCKSIVEITKVIGFELSVLQIKEKFGTLRFYYSIDDGKLKIPLGSRSKYNKLISDLVLAAEKKSETICEICGKKGKLYNDFWKKTRCKECIKNEK